LMPTTLSNKKQTDQDSEEFGMIWVFASQRSSCWL